MGSKDPIRIASVIITFVIFLTGSALSFWLYTQIIQSPGAASEKTITKLQIDQKKMESIKALTPPSVASPQDGYGRENPFVPYK